MYRDWDDPWDSLKRLRERVNTTFDDYVLGRHAMPAFVRKFAAFPRINLVETAAELTVECELPGVRKEDVEVSLRGRQLSIKGERPEPQAEGRSFHRHERAGGKFCRVVELPVDVNVETLSASLKDGVLIVKLPKSPEAQPRKVKVNAAE